MNGDTMGIVRRLKNHILFKTYISLDRNSKVVVGTEPMWGIPFNLYIPFAALYMAALGLTDINIGLIASITMFVSVIAGLLSGAVTDKMGRRLTTFLADLISWSIPCLLWAISRNFWWFAAAAALNGLWQVSNTSWNCLLVENVEKRHIVNVWQLIYLAGQLVVLFAPLSGLLVRTMSVVPAMRILYAAAFFSMTAKFFIMYKYCGETEQGKRRINEVKNISVFYLLKGYGGVLKSIVKSREITKVIMLSVLLTIGTTAVSTFFGLYATQNLGLPQDALAYLPILRAAIMLFFYFALTQKLSGMFFKKPVLIGITLLISGYAVIILAVNVVGTVIIYPVVLIYIALESFGLALVLPRRDSMMSVVIHSQERARMTSIINALITVAVMPFGYISGWLSSADRRMPFGLAIAVMTAAFILVLYININMEQDEEKKLGTVA